MAHAISDGGVTISTSSPRGEWSLRWYGLGPLTAIGYLVAAVAVASAAGSMWSGSLVFFALVAATATLAHRRGAGRLAPYLAGAGVVVVAVYGFALLNSALYLRHY
jgi:hypothetical protein